MQTLNDSNSNIFGRTATINQRSGTSGAMGQNLDHDFNLNNKKARFNSIDYSLDKNIEDYSY